MIVINNDAFKTVHLSFQFIEKIEEDAYSYRFLLARLLTSYTESFPTKKKLIDEFARLYGAFISNQIFLLGQYHVLRFTLVFPNPSLFDDANFLDDLLNLTKGFFFDRGSFEESNFTEVKRYATEYIQTREDRKFELAKDQLMSHMFPRHPYGNSITGTLDQIKAISTHEIFDYYQRYFLKNDMRMVLSGSVDQTMIDKINQILGRFETKDPFKVAKIPLVKKHFSHHESNTSMQQAYLFLCYSIPLERKDPLFLAAQLVSTMLGGYPDSMLFKRFREDLMLAYDVESHYEYDKKYLFVFAGVDVLNRHDALMELQTLIQNYISSGPTAEELSTAKKFLETQIYTSLDQHGTHIARAFLSLMFHINEGLDETLKRLNDVTLDDIKDVLSLMSLTTSYVLSGGDGDEIMEDF